MGEYYIYIHSRLDNKKPFYIGRGKKGRSKNFDNRNQHWRNIVNQAGGFSIHILESNLSHEEANAAEIKWIRTYKYNGYVLVNLTEGGGGTSGHRWTRGTFTKEHKEKLSVIAKRNIGEKNHFFGKTHSIESKLKMSESCKAAKAEARFEKFIDKHFV